MIIGLSANKSGFRTVSFDQNVNLIIADRSTTAGNKDTTNGLGKSTLLEIIDFCLGSNSRPNSGLRVDALSDWIFTLKLTLRGENISVSRSVENVGFIEIEGDTSNWPVKPKENKDGVVGLDLKQWRAILGWALFGIHETDRSGYKPSTRSLLSYFARSDVTPNYHPVLIRASALLLPMWAGEARGCVA